MAQTTPAECERLPLDAGHRGSKDLAQKVGSAALDCQVGLIVWGQDLGRQLWETVRGWGAGKGGRFRALQGNSTPSGIPVPSSGPHQAEPLSASDVSPYSSRPSFTHHSSPH